MTEAAEDLGLNYRALAVLRALLTFWPERALPCDGPAIVFPANRTLSERLGGMPESTLRRHLASLVEAGIVSRRDSPNRKRFSRRVAGIVARAYGFDLSPMARMAQVLQQTAQAAMARRERLCALRAHLQDLRQQLATLAPEHPLPEEIRGLLRRKLDEARLDALCIGLKAALKAVEKPGMTKVETAETSGSDNRNERHKDKEEESVSVSERNALAQDNETPNLARVITACPGFRDFFPDPVRHWPDLVRVADRLAPMLGIDPPVLNEAKIQLGPYGTTTAVLCIHERLADIRSPGAYLRSLSKRARTSGVSITSMLDALLHRQADCRLTI